MASRDKVVIQVDVDAASAIVALEAIDKKLKDLENRRNKIDRATKRPFDKDDDDRPDNLRKRNNEYDRRNRSFNSFGNILRGLTRPLTSFVKTLSKISGIALAGQIALFTGALLAMKLALITGRAAVDLYQIALKGLSVAAAGAATALAVAAAAMRQYNEAMMAPTFGGGRAGFQQAARVNRSIGVSRVASGMLGGEASTAVIAGLSKAGVSSTMAPMLTRQLINLAGGDPASVQAIAKAIGSGDLSTATKAVEGASGFRADSLQGVTSMQGLLSAVAGGSVVAENYQGLGGMLASTFVGTLKTEFAGLKTLFADLGEPLLVPFRNAFIEMSRILRADVLSMGQVIQKFGADSFAPTLVTIIERTSEFVRSNVINNLQNVEQMGESFVGFFRGVRDFFHGIGAFLVQFEPAADVVIEMFRAMGASGGGRGLFRSFSDLIVKNSEAFVAFGTSLGNVMGAIFDYLDQGQSGFFAKLPLLSDILDRIAFDVFPALTSVMAAIMPALEALPDILSNLADVLRDYVAPVLGVVAQLVAGIGGSGSMGAAALLGGFMFMKGGGVGKVRKSLREGMRRGPNPARAQMGMRAMNAASGILMGGTIAAGGIMESYQSGGMGGTLMSAGGGAAMGAAIGSIIAPGVGTAIGAAVGAAAGIAASVVADILGKPARAKRVTAGFDAYGKAMMDLDTAAMTRLESQEQLNALLDERALINAAGSEVFMEEREVYERSGFLTKVINQSKQGGPLGMLPGFLGDVGKYTPVGLANRAFGFFADKISPNEMVATMDPTSENYQALRNLMIDKGFVSEKDAGPDEIAAALQNSNIVDALTSTINRINFENQKYDSQLAQLTLSTGLASDEVANLADTLGINLKKSINETGVTAMMLAETLDEIDMTKVFLPEFARTPMTQAELRTTASAAMTTLGNAGTLEGNMDLLMDAVDAFATYDIAMGQTGFVAGISGLFEVSEQLIRGSNPVSEKFADELTIELNAAFGELLTTIGEDFDLDPEFLRSMVLDPGETFARDFSQADLERMVGEVERVKLIRGAMRFTDSSMSFEERAGIFKDISGADIRKSETFVRDFNLATGNEGALAGKSLEQIAAIAADAGVNANEILMNSLATDNQRDRELNELRNTTLAEIQGSNLTQVEATKAVLEQLKQMDFSSERYFSPEALRK